MHNDTQVVGKYLVTPFTKISDTGEYLAAVSLRRGMHDRIFRFVPRFASPLSAMRYALAQGRDMAMAHQPA